MPERLEYRFDCTVAAPDQPETVLSAASYDDGELDWWAFEIAAATPRPRAGDDAAPARETRGAVLYPGAGSFGGMPSPRFWEMEDRKIEFADIDSSTTDIAKILLTEFALVYANDWCLVPCETAVGSLTQVAGLVVTDGFGETPADPAGGAGN